MQKQLNQIKEPDGVKKQINKMTSTEISKVTTQAINTSVSVKKGEMSQVWKPAWCRASVKHSSNAEGNTILIWKHLVPVDPVQRSLFSRRCAGKGWASNQILANEPGRTVHRSRLPLDFWLMFSSTFRTSGEGNGLPFFIVRQVCLLKKG